MSYRDELMKDSDIRCHVTHKADIRFTDGALSHALGVTNVQIMRSSQDISLAPDGLGHLCTCSDAGLLAGRVDGSIPCQFPQRARRRLPCLAYPLQRRRPFFQTAGDFPHPLPFQPRLITVKGRKCSKAKNYPLLIHHRMAFLPLPTGVCWR